MVLVSILKTMDEVRSILTIPQRSQALGYSRLIEAEALAVLTPRSLAFLATQGGRREIETDGDGPRSRLPT